MFSGFAGMEVCVLAVDFAERTSKLALLSVVDSVN